MALEPEPRRPMGRRFACFAREHLLAIATAMVSLVATFWFVRVRSYSLYDDAYIYMRYAHNILQGCGLRWNCGDAPVEGFSSPLYLALSVLFARLSPDAESASQALGFLSVSAGLAGAGLLLPRLLGQSSRALVWAATLGATAFLALDHSLALNAVVGMDSALGMLAGVLILHAALAEGQRGLRLALCLGILVRFEFVVLLAALPLLPRARRLTYWIPLAVFLAALTLTRWFLFRDVLPNTFWVKSGGTGAHLMLGLRYLAQIIVHWPFLLGAPVALVMVRSHRSGLGFFLGGGLLWSAFVVRAGGDFYPHGRLLVPLLPAILALGIAGLIELGVALARRARVGTMRAAWVVLLLLGVAGAAWNRAHWAPAVHGYEQIERWAEVGKWIDTHRPGASVATAPIGAIGFFAPRSRIIDILGLTNPDARAWRSLPPERFDASAIGHERHNTDWVLAQKPDLFVTTHVLRNRPTQSLKGINATVWAEWQLMLAIIERRLPYRLVNLPLSGGKFWLAFERIPDAP